MEERERDNVFSCGRGFTRLPHRVTDRLIELRLPPFQRAVFDFVMEETWGKSMNFAAISLTEFVAKLNSDKRDIRDAIEALVDKGLLSLHRAGGKGGRGHKTVYELNRFESETPSDPSLIKGGNAPTVSEGLKGGNSPTLLEGERVGIRVNKGWESRPP